MLLTQGGGDDAMASKEMFSGPGASFLETVCRKNWFLGQGDVINIHLCCLRRTSECFKPG